jgi:ankyrin repeat protein
MLKKIFLFLCFFSSLAMANIGHTFVYENETTALHQAIFNQDDELASALIRSGANTNITFSYRDGVNRPLLYKLAQSLLPITLKEYIKANNDINLKMDSNVTALMVACFYGNAEIAKILVENKAELDLRDDTGNTAINYAAKKVGFYNLAGNRSDESLFYYLKDKGANATIKNNDNINAIDQLTANVYFFQNMEKFRATLISLVNANQEVHDLKISNSAHITTVEISYNNSVYFFNLKDPFKYSFNNETLTFTLEDMFKFHFKSKEELNEFKTIVVYLQKYAQYL